MAVRRIGTTLYVATVRVGAASNPSGKIVTIKTTATTLRRAKRAEMEIRRSVLNCGTWPPRPLLPGADGTLVDALWEASLDWKAQKGGERARLMARECIDRLGPLRLCADITPADISRLIVAFRARGNTDAAIFKKLNALYRLFWHAQRKGWIADREPLRPPEELMPDAAAFE